MTVMTYVMHEMVLSRIIYNVYDPWSYDRTSRVSDSFMVIMSGCAGGRVFVPRPGQ